MSATRFTPCRVLCRILPMFSRTYARSNSAAELRRSAAPARAERPPGCRPACSYIASRVEQEAGVALEHGQVGGDVRQRVVDLVGHAGGEHAQRGQLLRLDDPGAHLVTLDELTDLGAQAAHHFQDGRIGGPGLAAEELEHAQAIATKQDRHGEGGMQAVRQGGRLTGEIGIVGEVRNPARQRRYPRLGPEARPLAPWPPRDVMASNAGAGSRAVARRATQRSRCVGESTLQNAPRSQSRLSQIVSRIFGPDSAGESASASTRVVSYCAASRRSAFLRRVMSWKTTTPPWSAPSRRAAVGR